MSQATLTPREKQLVKQCKLLNFFGSGCGKCECNTPKDCKIPELERLEIKTKPEYQKISKVIYDTQCFASEFANIKPRE